MLYLIDRRPNARGKSAVKGILAGVFGIMVGTIGISPAGTERGTMGLVYLIDGFPTIALLVAMFTIPGIVEMCTVPEALTARLSASPLTTSGISQITMTSSAPNV